MAGLKSNIYFKIGVIILLTLILLIPVAMITGLINDREQIQDEAITEVSNKWAVEQSLTGPFLAVPYYKYVKQEATNDQPERVIQVQEYFYSLPNKLNVNGDLKPQRRARGIYEVVVYNSLLKFNGSFEAIDLASLNIRNEDVQWDKAELVLGIDDLRGIQKLLKLQWGDTSVDFNSGVSSSDIASSGINAQVNLEADKAYNFKFQLDLNGSQLLYFTPVGKVTDVKIASSWPDPKFNGAFLPDSSSVKESGFNANWNVLHLNRNYPQLWKNKSFNIDGSSFGVDLLLPVDNYQKSYRAVNYSILFVALTFLVFFFIEVMSKIFIHPVQYLLVGVALVVFYTLLISISEHLNFNLAFIISAVATLLLIAGYTRAILKSAKLAMVVTGILAILYTFIYTIIQLQDYALLIGSIGIFVILGLVMYFSRKIDWYSLNMPSDKAKSGEVE